MNRTASLKGNRRADRRFSIYRRIRLRNCGKVHADCELREILRISVLKKSPRAGILGVNLVPIEVERSLHIYKATSRKGF